MDIDLATAAIERYKKEMIEPAGFRLTVDNTYKILNTANQSCDDDNKRIKGLPKPVFSFLGKWDEYINNIMKDVNK